MAAKYTELGLKLQEIRIEKGLSLREAAKLTGVDRETIGGIERGTRKAYPLTVGKIAKGLGVPPRELLVLEGAAKEEPVETENATRAGEEAARALTPEAAESPRTVEQSRMMEAAAGSVLMRDPSAYHTIVGIIHLVHMGAMTTEDAEVEVAELFVPREEAQRRLEGLTDRG